LGIGENLFLGPWSRVREQGQTIEVTAAGRFLAPGTAVTGTPGTSVTAIAIPYFQWDNRDGGPMRIWLPC
jgi:DUF1680 family protein